MEHSKSEMQETSAAEERKAGRRAGRQAGRHMGRKEGRKAGTHLPATKRRSKKDGEKKVRCLPVGESNPGLPRDRRGYLPLY